MIAIRAEFGLYLGIAAYEILMGFGFNTLTAWLEKKGYLEGFTSLMVAAGVFLTLIPWLLFALPSWTTLGGFICSGMPMVVGSITRYIQRRDDARKVLARLSDYGDQPPGMAQ